MNFLFVALGGALGAVCRYAVSLIPIKMAFPVLTLITNIVGAFVIGLIVGVTESRSDVPPGLILFLKTGVCGGFTTFSTFSLEAYQLFEKNEYISGGAYAFLSLVCCIAGVWAGKRTIILLETV